MFEPMLWASSIPDSTSFVPSSVASTVEFAVCWIFVMSDVIFVVACFDSSASFLISPATIAKPFPCSPARAASTAALSASRLVCSAISSTSPIVDDIDWIKSDNSRIAPQLSGFYALL